MILMLQKICSDDSRQVRKAQKDGFRYFLHTRSCCRRRYYKCWCARNDVPDRPGPGQRRRPLLEYCLRVQEPLWAAMVPLMLALLSVAASADSECDELGMLLTTQTTVKDPNCISGKCVPELGRRFRCAWGVRLPR